jgi:hypothetical protein
LPERRHLLREQVRLPRPGLLRSHLSVCIPWRRRREQPGFRLAGLRQRLRLRARRQTGKRNPSVVPELSDQLPFGRRASAGSPKPGLTSHPRDFLDRPNRQNGQRRVALAPISLVATHDIDPGHQLVPDLDNATDNRGHYTSTLDVFLVSKPLKSRLQILRLFSEKPRNDGSCMVNEISCLPIVSELISVN